MSVGNSSDDASRSVLVIQRALQIRDLDKALAAFLALPAVDLEHEQWLEVVVHDAYRAGMFDVNTLLSFLKRLPDPDWTLDGCRIVNRVHNELEASAASIHHVPALPLGYLLCELARELEGDRKVRAQSYWYEWISPAVRAIVEGRAIRFKATHHNEVLYAAADELSFDSLRRSLFTWQLQWTADGRKDEWLFIPATQTRDRFLLQNLQYNELVYAADHMKLTSDPDGKQQSRVFSWRNNKEAIGGMGVWQLVRVDPTNRDVFALYNPYQNQYLFTSDSERDRSRRHILTQSHDPSDATWLQMRKWLLTPVESSLLEKLVEAFFTKQYADVVTMSSLVVGNERSDPTTHVVCYVYRMAANLRLTNIGLIPADFDSLERLGGGKAAMFHGLHHLWVEAAATVNTNLTHNERLSLLPAEVQLQRADRLFAGKHYPDALAVYQDIVNAASTTNNGSERLKRVMTEAEVRAAKCYFAVDQTQNALVALEGMLELKADSLDVDAEARVLLWIGRCKRQQKLFDDAMHALERAFNTATTTSSWLCQSIALEMQVVEICRRELLDQLLASPPQDAESSSGSKCQLAEEMVMALQCPLSLELMQDPVVSPTGTTYERRMIEHHLDVNGQFDPVTRTALSKSQLAPNRALKTVLEMLLSEHKLGKLLRTSSS